MAQEPSGGTGIPQVDAFTCQQATALLIDYVAGELTAQTAQALQEHLRVCKDCVAYLQTYRATIAATRALRYEDMPAALQERLCSFLRDHGAPGV